ncbi:MAG: hypothetical protein WD844_16315 [Thermoleophilaceae bacterium]
MRLAAPVAVALVLLAAAPAEARRAPVVKQLVVTASGRAYADTVRASSTTVRVGRRRCRVSQSTPLAALVRSDVPRLSLRDFGRCSRRARDAAGLYVRAIGRDRERGREGWVYKVGNRQGSAGAADPSGPFGRGRLRGRPRILWFYCALDEEGSCQRTLALRARPEPGGVAVRVLAYDDRGRSVPAAGATVRAGATSAVADAGGLARLELPAGRHRLRAEQEGRIRSFDEVVRVAR